MAQRQEIFFDAVLCDLDGVLRHWDPGLMSGLDAEFGLPDGALAAAAFHADRLVPAVTGAITDEAWREAVAVHLTPACGAPERARALVAAWTDTPGSVDGEALALLTRARRQVPVVLVTNATTRLDADLAALGLTGAVDAVVNSAREGVAKPDPGIFLVAAARAGVAVDRCLFVDDTLGHVTAAQRLGMTAVHHRGIADLRAALGPVVQG
ncbi:HAD-IA family hydrolase [Streptomyces profundus]|uniref:HAD-IA family hydrolase n=1 Tax=Streptomyces profundus TaxID=2867410 RepID=UPI001D1619B8|nr:HAD-IA family hydrolase [Streptomyces sp. MA3_2.13]